MAEVKEEVHFWQDLMSSRAIGEVAEGEDHAHVLIESSSSGDIPTLQSVLAQPDYIKFALQRQHVVLSEVRPRQDASDVREVTASLQTHLSRAVSRAIEHDHAAAVSTLLHFAKQQGEEAHTLLGHSTVGPTVKNGNANMFKAMVAAYPTVLTTRMSHSGRPLDIAVTAQSIDMVALILQLGAHLETTDLSSQLDMSYHQTTIGKAVLRRDTRILEMLLKHGAPVSKCGALPYAASFGRLDAMRLLIQHGADVNELYWRGEPPQDESWKGTWTPMHHAASTGQVDAMQLLESNGANPNAKDARGKTPAQVLEEQRLASAGTD